MSLLFSNGYYIATTQGILQQQDQKYENNKKLAIEKLIE